MTEIDFFGFAFYSFIFAGMWLLKQKNKVGWLVRLLGELGWVGIGLAIGMPSIWIPGLIFMWLDVSGYLQWEHEEEMEELETKFDKLDVAVENLVETGIRPKQQLEYNLPRRIAYTKFGVTYDPKEYAVGWYECYLKDIGDD